MKKTLLTLAAGSLLAASASAQLVITEAMTNSSHPGGAANGDWWELTNTGASTIDLTGYYWDDDGPSGNDGALFPSIDILAGQSLVIVDENSSNVADFVTAWGGGFTAISAADFTGQHAHTHRLLANQEVAPVEGLIVVPALVKKTRVPSRFKGAFVQVPIT